MSVHSPCPSGPIPHPSRRRVLAGFGATGAAAALLSIAPLARAADTETQLFEGRLAIPSTFVGQHFHAPLAEPSYKVGLWRSHDGPAMQWRDAHLGPGRFDWSSHDRAIDHYFKLGLPCNYCLYGTPAWISSRPTRPDPYNRPGASSSPSSPDAVEEFVRALLGRYRGRIRWIEIWNEFNNTAGAVFWQGSLDELAGVGRSVWRAAKDVAPEVVVLGPSVTSDDESLARYLRADDGHGGKAARWLDAVAVHPYRGYGWRDPQHGRDLELGQWITQLRRRMADGGLPATTPIYITEIGYHWATDHPSVAANTPGQFANWIEQVVLRAATLGVAQIDLYSHTATLIGDPSRHAVVAQAIDRLARQLAGQTLLRVTRTAGGHYRAVTTGGELLLGGRP